MRQEIFTFENLYKAYKSCLEGKVSKSSFLEFEKNREKNLLEMARTLSARTYKTGPFTCFAISDPKLREVWAADFKDRITHHLLVSKIQPIWEKIFIYDSYACRTAKGAHKAVGKIKKIIANNPDMYYLHLDVRGFFTSIDKEILFSIIFKKVKNPDLVYLAKLIIFHNPKSNYVIKGDEKLLRTVPLHKSLFGMSDGKGLPIGNYTSQFFANVYLNELDQYAKRILKCHHYFRYMDDMIILDKNKGRLKDTIRKISCFLEEKLKIELHPKKTILQDVRKGIDSLGYIVRPEYSLSRRRVVGNLKMKLKQINSELGKIQDIEEIESIVKKALCIINSYWGHFKHADCASLKKKIFEKYFGELKKYLEPSEPVGHFVLKKGIFSAKKSDR